MPYENQNRHRTCEEYILNEYIAYKQNYDFLQKQLEETIKARDAYQQQSTKLRDEIMRLAVCESDELVSLAFMKGEEDQFPEVSNLIRLGKIKRGEL